MGSARRVDGRMTTRILNGNKSRRKSMSRPENFTGSTFANISIRQASYKAERAQKEKKNALRQKEAQKKESDPSSRKHLAGIRVVQKNLVYVTGLQPTTREDRLLETLRGEQYFGQYGKIIKIVVSKGKEGAQHVNQSVGIYVTFARKEDAEKCIRVVDGSQNVDRVLKFVQIHNKCRDECGANYITGLHMAQRNTARPTSEMRHATTGTACFYMSPAKRTRALPAKIFHR